MKPLVAVSGKNGQLGWEIQQLSASHSAYEFIFCDRDELDIADHQQVKAFFDKHKPQFFINCAAYTAVDKAETDRETAFKINAEAVGILAEQCKLHNTVFITFSTDYVFNGNGSAPYKEEQATEPLNYYGYTKNEGEKLALEKWNKTFVIRTSWVYSEQGHNFVKTMLRLMKERPEINVVNDQVGSPTYAKDLARTCFKMVGDLAYMQKPGTKKENSASKFGIYHFSNEGITTWFEFANEIRTLAKLECKVNPVTSEQFPTPAKRPRYSVLNKEKIMNNFNIDLRPWQESLKECLAALKVIQP